MKKVKLNPECFKRHYPPHEKISFEDVFNVHSDEALQAQIAELEKFISEYEGHYQFVNEYRSVYNDALEQLYKLKRFV